MLFRRLVSLTIVLALVAVVPAAASAKVVKVSVSPAKPVSTTKKLVLSFVADRTLSKRARYVGTFSVDQPAPLHRCAAGTLETRSKAGIRKGATVKLTYVPTDRWSTGRWCPGKIQLLLETVTTDKVGSETTKTVPDAVTTSITQDPSVPPPAILYTPARLILLDPSTMTISAPGHADRTTVLTGTLAARKPGHLDLNKDYDFTVVSGSITAAAPPADPLCSADPDPWPTTFVPQPDVSTALLRVNGTASYDYVLPIDAARLTGCRGHGSGPTTTVALTGKLDSHKLSRLPMTATVPFTLLDGTAATITFNIFVKVEILDENQVP